MGAVPVCLDTLEKGHLWVVKWGPLIQGDIGDSDLLRELFRSENYFGSTVHARSCTWQATFEVGESVQFPDRYLHNNATKTQVLIDAAIRHEVDVFVFLSTCAVCGYPEVANLPETHRILPLNPYAASKALVENKLRDAGGSGLRSAALRYFNAAGSDPEAEIGESHTPETHLIPLACDSSLGIGPQLMLHGADYPTHDGSCVRDFVHVCDLARAHVRAIGWLNGMTRTGHQEAFNLGTGNGHLVLEVLEQTKRVAGRAVPFKVSSRRVGDSHRLVGDISKASQILQ